MYALFVSREQGNDRDTFGASMTYDVRFDLDGWEIFFAELVLQGQKGDSTGARATAASRARAVLRLENLAGHPPVAALRKLFKEAGTDPSRYRPASEALLRRILKGEEIPAVHPLVDVNSCLSVMLAVPCCVMAEGSFEPPFEFRAGRDGESYESLRGPFRLQGKPLLLDRRGPCDAPISGSERVKVSPVTRCATLVAYLPRGVVTKESAARALTEVLGEVEGVREVS
jgi:DNA/RNA-binding domain of Phe-tRNA-synthetase-like protein